MTGGSNGAAKPAVTQRDLEAFLALQRQLSSLKRQYTLAKERLIQLVDGHAPVEPGRLGVEVRESARQLITKSFLVSVLGEEDYEAMRAEAPPTMYCRLVVGERARGQTTSLRDWMRAQTWTSFVREDPREDHGPEGP